MANKFREIHLFNIRTSAVTEVTITETAAGNKNYLPSVEKNRGARTCIYIHGMKVYSLFRLHDKKGRYSLCTVD